MARYLFALAAVDRPVGGRNVMIWAIEHLTRRGTAAHPVYPYRRYSYDFATTSAKAFYDPRLSEAYSHNRRAALRQSLGQRLKGRGDNDRLVLAPDDVIVIPEFGYPEVAPLYPAHRRVLLAQDVSGFARAHTRDLASGGTVLGAFEHVLVTSEASEAAVRTLAGRDSLRLRIPLTPYRFTQHKKKVVAYMPRKRPKEAELIVTALKQMPEFAGWQFVRIAGMSAEELARTYEEALIFLSFSRNEGFGLPPAEAMSAGCVVVGYTGVGGEEYFTDNTGFPVADSDIVAFIERARRVAQLQASDPGQLDRLRRRAAEHVVSAYSVEVAEAALEAAWSRLEETTG